MGSLESVGMSERDIDLLKKSVYDAAGKTGKSEEEANGLSLRFERIARGQETDSDLARDFTALYGGVYDLGCAIFPSLTEGEMKISASGLALMLVVIASAQWVKTDQFKVCTGDSCRS